MNTKEDMLVRRVRVDRNLSPREALYVARCNTRLVDYRILDTMPKGEGYWVEVVLFKPLPDEYTCPGCMNDDEVAKAFENRGLKEDPFAVLAANASDHTLMRKINARHCAFWKDAEGNRCVIEFSRFYGGRFILVNHVNNKDNGLLDFTWFAGVRK